MSGIKVTLTTPNSSEIDVRWTPGGRANVKRRDSLSSNTPTRQNVSSWNDTSVSCGPLYTYTVSNSSGQGKASSGTLDCATTGSRHLITIGHDIFSAQPTIPTETTPTVSPTAPSPGIVEGQAGSFAFLVPRTTEILHYIHTPGSIKDGNWQLAHKLGLPDGDGIQDTALSLVQNISGNLEALARVTPLQNRGNDTLAAYEFTSQAGWQGPFTPSSHEGPIDGVTGSQALIVTARKAFELLVPRGALIYHYMHDLGTITDGPWELVATLQPFKDDNRFQPTAVSFMQSRSGSLKAIARVTPPPDEGDDFLVGYEFDTESGWSPPIQLLADDHTPINHVTGSQALLHSFRDTFELVVPQGGLIHHYTHDSGSVTDGPWNLVATLNPPNDDNQIQAISVTLAINIFGNLELAARERSLQGRDFFVGYEFDAASGWTNPAVLESDQGPIIASDSGHDHCEQSDGSDRERDHDHGHDRVHDN